ncbi:MAG: MFS transporter [Methylacidiphilales bacterium]|nr:MFS transporter [Candidatus Methylacidiphilales bacterium]
MATEANDDSIKSSIEGTGANAIYRVGTLSYTRVGLGFLFLWLLWGDFCYTVMQSVTGPIMQLKFQALDASNTEIALLLTSIPTALYSFLNPIISFRSDRFRSRFGRRIPFIAGSLPFLVLFLFALAYGEQIGYWVRDHLGPLTMGIPPNQVVILTLGLLLLLFTFFNTFVASTFWYLFNDVVPEFLLARFMSVFRAIGQLSTALYSYYIFPQSSAHSTEIFISAAMLYLLGFGLMCWKVREGEYPPPAPLIDGQTSTMAAVVTYARGTHAFPIYWYLWICTFIGGIAGGAAIVGATTFGLYFYLALGLNLQQIGDINALLGVVVGVMTLGAGWLADRYHPIRVVVIGSFLSLVIVTPMNLIWLFWQPSPTMAFWVTMVITFGLAAPSMALGGMWDPPMLMRIFPRSQFGQFCSTNAVWRSIGGIIGGFMTGIYLDYMKGLVGKEKAYFYLPIWALLFGIPSFLLLYRFYLSWKKLGGDEAYIPPVLETIQLTNLPYPVEKVIIDSKEAPRN